MIYRRADAVGMTRAGVADGVGNANGTDEKLGAEDEGEEEKGGGDMVREEEAKGTNKRWEDEEGAQCIWLARVRPEDCEGIIRYTVLQGKVVKPERQLRGGFDRAKGLTSW